jgi:hypothetical protein
MPGRSHQLDPESLGVIVGREDVDDLDIAPVAGADIGMVDPQRLTKGFLA